MNREQDILSRLDELERFMTRHRVRAWADEFHRVQVEAGADSVQLRRRVLEMYRGSMGSLTDLIISRVNGHDVEDGMAANAEIGSHAGRTVGAREGVVNGYRPALPASMVSSK